MEVNLDLLSSELLAMPAKNRAILAKRLLDSLEETPERSDEHEELWVEEAERRYKEIKEGKTQTRSASVVMREVRARYSH